MQEERIHQQIDELNQKWNILSSKLVELERAKILATDTEEIFKLKHKISEISEERKEVDQQLNALEDNLKLVRRQNGISSSNLLEDDLSKKDVFIDLISKNVIGLMKRNSFEGLAIDECLMIAGSPDFQGWTTQEIYININNEQTAQLPEDLNQIVSNYRDIIAKNYYNSISYRVVSFKPWLTERPLQISLEPIEWYTYFTLKSYLDEPVLEEQGKTSTIREKYDKTALKYGNNLYPDIPTNVSIHIVAQSSDNKLIIIQRSSDLDYYPNAWSISFEETMNSSFLRKGKIVEADEDFFDAALRGVYEELGSSLIVDTNSSRILSCCVEYPTLSFDVICVVKIKSEFSEIKRSWLTAHDKHEAKKIEAVPINLISLSKLFYSKRTWHPTSRMRLFQLMYYEFGKSKTESALSSQQK